MKNSILKSIVIVLLIMQAAIGFLSIFVLNFFYTNSGIKPELDFGKLPLFAILIISFVISIIFVGIIVNRASKIIEKAPSLKPIAPPKETPESKRKSERDQKLIQAQNEKKSLMLNELMKNLNLTYNLESYANQALINISKQLDIFQGILFVKSPNDGVYRKAGTYAYYTQEEIPEFNEGVGLSGQVASSKKLLNIVNIPEKYMTVLSGLGKSAPTNLIILPILNQNSCIGIVELASFIKFDSLVEQVLSEYSLLIGKHIAEINKPAESADI